MGKIYWVITILKRVVLMFGIHVQDLVKFWDQGYTQLLTPQQRLLYLTCQNKTRQLGLYTVDNHLLCVVEVYTTTTRVLSVCA